MQRVDSREVQASLDEYLEKDNAHNRNERKRLGEQFYKKLWGCMEATCGHCGAVYRFPNVIATRENTPTTVEDLVEFNNRTAKNKCPCCQLGLNISIKIDPTLIVGKREIEINGIVLLKLNVPKALPIPEQKAEIEE